MNNKNFSISKIFELRKKTSLGIIECKKALELNEGDINKSINFLKKKWKYIDEKEIKNKKLSNNGIVIADTNINNTVASIISLNCESDFVAKNKRFLSVCKYISKASLLCIDRLSILSYNIEKENCNIQDMISELKGTMKENISFSFKRLLSPFVCCYNHTGNKIASLVSFSNYLKGIEEVGKNIAMQIVAMNPIYIYNEKNNEKSSLYLMDQNFIKNTDISVHTYIKNFNKKLNILDFKIIKL